jgi:hypothetical protein
LDMYSLISFFSLIWSLSLFQLFFFPYLFYFSSLLSSASLSFLFFSSI